MSLERLKELFHELNCVQYGNFKLASGGISYYKIICDPLFENPEARGIIGKLGYEALQEIENGKTCEIVGVVTGGYEFAKLVAERAGRKAISVNPHNGEVNGSPKDGSRCYFEDIVTKGGSVLKCHNILGRNEKDNYAISFVDRLEGAEENLRMRGIKLKCFLTKNDLGIK